MMHMCGCVRAFLPRLIELGLDVYDDQLAAMFDHFEPLDRSPYFKTVEGKETHLTTLTAAAATRYLRGHGRGHQETGEEDTSHQALPVRRPRRR